MAAILQVKAYVYPNTGITVVNDNFVHAYKALLSSYLNEAVYMIENQVLVKTSCEVVFAEILAAKICRHRKHARLDLY